MRKLSEIYESHWSEMNRRSQGIKSRKEDDIDLLDQVGLYEYILAHYELTDKRFEMTYGSKNMAIPVSRNGQQEILLTYIYGEVHLFFNLEKYKKLYDILIEKYNIEKWDSTYGDIHYHYVVSPKEKCTNRFYIDVLNDIIDNGKTILRRKNGVNESHWSEMNRRSQGITVRKEDNYEIMDIENFYDYLRTIYKCDEDDIIQLLPCSGAPGEISNMIYVYMFDYNHVLSYNGAAIDTQYSNLDLLNCKKDAQTRYRIKTIRNYYGTEFAEIYPKDRKEEVSNKFFLEVLDYLLDQVKFPFTKNLELRV